jgi:glycosyltransferase involved in cell wall biosynthesis
MNDLKFSILIPTYNGAEVIGDTLRSILTQSFQNYEIIINDDASTDNTEDLIKSLNDPRIKFFRNAKNLGYPGNLNSAFQKATGDIVYLMGQDDILAIGALENTYRAFKKDENIGAVARPYFWFDEDIKKPVRATKQLNSKQDLPRTTENQEGSVVWGEIVKITDSFKRIILTIDVAGQLSGLAIRKKFINLPFHPDIFPCHVYPFIDILKNHPIVFLKDYNVAVRIRSSQCRSVSSIYDKSPIESWVDFFNSVFAGKEYEKLREYGIKNYVAKNYIGLIQIRCFGRHKYKYLLREIGYLLKYRPENIFSPAFWFFSLGCIIMPAGILVKLTDWYKREINSKKLRNINFDYKI